MPIASNLAEAISVLDPSPLDASQDDWYVENSTSTPSGQKLHPLALLRANILRARDGERLFLSGGVGCGKTTELRRLMRDPQITRKYFIVSVELTPEELPELTGPQLLFIIAAEIYAQAEAAGLLRKSKKRWGSILKRLDDRFFGKTGISSDESSLELKFNLVFVELRQQLKLQSKRREELRMFAETEGTILVDLINELVDDVSATLVAAGTAEQVLVVVDEANKVRTTRQMDEIFHANLGALCTPRVPMVITSRIRDPRRANDRAGRTHHPPATCPDPAEGRPGGSSRVAGCEVDAVHASRARKTRDPRPVCAGGGRECRDLFWRCPA